MPKVSIVVGTRPNFIKVTRFKALAQHYPHLSVELVHTGQHHDDRMAGVFFKQLGLEPDRYLAVPSASPAQQVAATIAACAAHFTAHPPQLVVAVGDVNSTLAAAIAANKCGIALAHLESGLRSGDKSMPEEHNRIVTDHLACLHFVTEDAGLRNLQQEGIASAGICYSGNTMIDTLVSCAPQIAASTIREELSLQEHSYAVVTMHRPGNVDTAQGLQAVAHMLAALCRSRPVVFPVHPRTKNQLARFGMDLRSYCGPNLRVVPPLDYFSFQKLLSDCAFAVTDSGGIQEETTYLRKPCYTLRPSTERPVTIDLGSNELLPLDTDALLAAIDRKDSGHKPAPRIPPLWDGHATERVLQRIAQYFEAGS